MRKKVQDYNDGRGWTGCQDVKFIANSQAHMYPLKHDISARIVSHVRRVLEHFSRLFVIELMRERKGSHIAPMIIDVSYTNHV